MSDQEAEELITKYDYRRDKVMMNIDKWRLPLILIFVWELLQAGFLVWFVAVVSFLPEYLNTDWTFVVYKIFWINIIIELTLHLITWALLYVQTQNIRIKRWDPKIFRSVWVWFILIGEIVSCLYTIFTLIWASIVTGQEWNGLKPFSDGLYKTFSVTLLVALFLDAIVIFLEFLTLVYYFRKMIIHARIVERLKSRAGFMSATKFLADNAGMVTGIKYLKTKCSDQQIKAMANMTTGCNKWSHHDHKFENDDYYEDEMDDVNV